MKKRCKNEEGVVKMVLIDKEQAAKQIRGNQEYVADCQWLKGYNKACEDNAQIVEQMDGREIIPCENCLYKKICSWRKEGAKFCSFGVKEKEEAE